MRSVQQCWCGNTDLRDFSAHYKRCPVCETLVAKQIPESKIDRVNADEQHFYGREYWFSYQEEVLGLPNIADRARSDLYDRCPYWLKILLKYLHPPASMLDLGAGNGSFAFLMRSAGFDVTGLELSPWLADYVRKTFGVQMLAGRLEDQKLPQGSLDGIVMMDVLEHLANPLDTLDHCRAALKPNGLLMIQTPCYTEGISMEQMKAGNSRFPEVMRDRGHLLLYSRTSVARLLKRAGYEYLYFEPALFAHYDMFFLAARKPLVQKPPEVVDRLLEQTPESRLVRGLIDLNSELDRLTTYIEHLEKYRRYINRCGGQMLVKAVHAWRSLAGKSK